MRSYIVQEGHPESLSKKEEEELLDILDETGTSWYYDLGQDNNNDDVSLLIIEEEDYS